jgi:DNA-binding NtrC family response regulator
MMADDEQPPENGADRPTILVADDSEIARRGLAHLLRRNGFNCIEACDGREALELLEQERVDLLLSDQQMPRMDGLALLNEVKARHDGIPFILLTGHGSVNDAVASIKRGADDYIEKPHDPDTLLATIKRSLSYRDLAETNRKLKDHLTGSHSFQNIVTGSAAMSEALRLAEKAANSPSVTVVLYGESGTGKEVLAQAIHFAGVRMANKFVAVNCAGIPVGLMESELFGHAKGAFTGADRDRLGKFELAQGGTILLDEIGDMPLDVQAKLLRVLEERAFERVGANARIKADCRVIAATHKDLQAMVKEGKFREDLFHRINVFPITLPPLRERREDIPVLAAHFLEKFRTEFGKSIPGLTAAALDRLLVYRWPGNVRELRNCLERAAILIDNEPIGPAHLNIERERRGSGAGAIRSRQGDELCLELTIKKADFSLDTVIDRTLQFALDRCKNNKTEAAQFLKVDRKLFYRRGEKG